MRFSASAVAASVLFSCNAALASNVALPDATASITQYMQTTFGSFYNNTLTSDNATLNYNFSDENASASTAISGLNGGTIYGSVSNSNYVQIGQKGELQYYVSVAGSSSMWIPVIISGYASIAASDGWDSQIGRAGVAIGVGPYSVSYELINNGNRGSIGQAFNISTYLESNTKTLVDVWEGINIWGTDGGLSR